MRRWCPLNGSQTTPAREHACLAWERPECAQSLLAGWADQGEAAQGLQVPPLVHVQIASLLSSMLCVCRAFLPGAEELAQAGRHCLCFSPLRQVPVGQQVGFP